MKNIALNVLLPSLFSFLGVCFFLHYLTTEKVMGEVVSVRPWNGYKSETDFLGLVKLNISYKDNDSYSHVINLKKEDGSLIVLFNRDNEYIGKNKGSSLELSPYLKKGQSTCVVTTGLNFYPFVKPNILGVCK